MADQPEVKKKVDGFTKGSVFGLIAITWMAYIILAMTWSSIATFWMVPVIITVLALAAGFRFWAAGVVAALLTIFMIFEYEAIPKVFNTVQSVRDPLTVALEKTDTKLETNVGRKVDSVTTDIDSSATRLSQAEKDSILDAAKAYRENKEFLQLVAETAGVAKSKPKVAAAPKEKVDNASGTDTTTGTVTYQAYDVQMRVVQVPPHTKVKLTARTSGYICDPSLGMVMSIHGMDYYPDGMQFSEGFPARNARVFCLLAKLDDQPPQAFVNGTCTFYNDTEDTLDCIVLLNERNDWSDNSGSIEITPTLTAL